MTVSCTLHHPHPTEPSESLDHLALSDEHSAYFDAERSTDSSKTPRAKHDNIHNLAGGVPRTPRTIQEPRIDEHVRRKQDIIAQ